MATKITYALPRRSAHWSGILATLPLLILVGCASVTVQTPQLSTSLGLPAIENMGELYQRNASIAVYIEPSVRDLMLRGEHKSTKFEFRAGQALTTKLLKALSYQFNRVVILKSLQSKPDPPADAVMTVGLQDADMSFNIRPGWDTITTSSFVRLVVRSELRDREGTVIWVGTARSEGQGEAQARGILFEEQAARQIAIGVESAIDTTVADLIKQMIQSPNMRRNLQEWEHRRRT